MKALLVLLFSTTIFSSSTLLEVPQKYKEAICKDIKGETEDEDSYDVKNCLRGTFSTIDNHIYSYLGTNKRGFKFSCQYKIDKNLAVQAGTVCIDLFIKKWPKN